MSLIEAKILRDGGALTVSIKSATLEDIFRAASGGRTSMYDWSDGSLQIGEGRTLTRFEGYSVRADRLNSIAPGLLISGGSALTDADGRVNLIPLLVKGLSEGIKIFPSTPYPAEILKRFATSLHTVGKNIIESAKPVDIIIQVRAGNGGGVRVASPPEASNAPAA